MAYSYVFCFLAGTLLVRRDALPGYRYLNITIEKIELKDPQTYFDPFITVSVKSEYVFTCAVGQHKRCGYIEHSILMPLLHLYRFSSRKHRGITGHTHCDRHRRISYHLQCHGTNPATIGRNPWWLCNFLRAEASQIKEGLNQHQVLLLYGNG